MIAVRVLQKLYLWGAFGQYVVPCNLLEDFEGMSYILLSYIYIYIYNISVIIVFKTQNL